MGEAGSGKRLGIRSSTSVTVLPSLTIIYPFDIGSAINGKKHYILRCAHPSPLSADRGFFGCKHFSKTNTYLKENNRQVIDWNSLSKSL